MKIFLKVLKISALVFFGLIIILIAAGWALQDKIIETAIDKAGETIGAPMDIEEISFSLIDDFPDASLDLKKVWIGKEISNEQNETVIDTLARINELSISLNVEKLLDNIYTIHNVEITDAFIKYTVDTAGVSCYDFLIPTDSTAVDTLETESAPLDLDLKSLSLKNVTLVYSDDQLGAGGNVFIPELSGTVDIDSLKMDIKSKGALTAQKLRYDGTNAHKLSKAELVYDVEYLTDSVIAKNFSLKTDELSLDANGGILIGDQIDVDVNVETLINNLGDLLKYAPDEMMDTLQIDKVGGKLAVKAKVKGEVGEEDLPFYDVTYDLANASAQYDEYPLANNINLSGTATNGKKKNNQTTAINLKLFEADFSGNHIQLAGQFSNLNRLNYSIQSSLDLNLTQSKALIPNEDIKKLNGMVSAVISTKGTLPDSINNKFIESAIQNTKLSLDLANVDVLMDSVPEIRKLNAKLKFSDNHLSLSGLDIYIPEYEEHLINTSAEVSFKGQYTNPESLDIKVPHFNISTTENNIKGSASVCDLKEVTYNITSALDLKLAKLKKYAPDTLVKDLKGDIFATISSYGKLHLDSIEQHMMPIIFDQSSFDIRIKDVTTSMTDDMMNIKGLNGRINLSNRLLQISHLKGEYSKVKFDIDTTSVQNLVETVIENKSDTLKIESVSHFGHIDYNALMKKFFPENASNNPNDKAKESTEPSEPINWKIESKGRFKAESLKYGDALIENISGLYNYRDTIMIIDQLYAEAFEGNTTTSIKIELGDSSLMNIKLKATVDKMNMSIMAKELAYIFNEYITYKQLKGILSSDETYLQFSMKGDEVDLDGMRMKSHFLFENGGFYNYPPVTESLKLMPSTKDHPDTLLFNTMDSYIFIFKHALNIPNTKIVTNKLSAKLIGEQSFGEDYDYRVGINYKDVLNKSKKNKAKKEDLVEMDIDDVELEKLKWWKASGRGGNYKNIPITSKEYYKKENRISLREELLDLRFDPKRFTFDTKVDF